MAAASSVQRCQVPIGCQLCQGRNTIQWKCVDCQLLMCSSCKDNIHLRIAEDHNIINIKDIGELDSGASFNFSDVHCNEHSNQVCCSYCSTCKTVVCVKCIMTIHNGHQFVEREEFSSKKKKLWDRLKNAVKQLDELSSRESQLTKRKEIKDVMYNKEKEKIQIRLTNDGDQWSKKLVELDEKKQSDHQRIDIQLRNLDKEKGKFQEVINVVDIIKSSKDFCQFFEKFDELIFKLNCDSVPLESNIQPIPPFFFDVEYLKSERDKQIAKNLREQNSFKVIIQYTTDIMSIHYITELSDQTLLISDNKSKVVQHVRLEETNVQVISNFRIKIYGMAVSPSGDILLSTADTRLKVFNIKNGEVTDSVYNVHPLKTINIHVSKDKRVIIGAKSPGHRFPATGKRVVVVMDLKGKHLKEHGYDSNNKPLFTYPNSITTSSNGNIFVVDKLDTGYRGRVVVLGQGGDVLQIYPSYNPYIRTFEPRDLLTMASGSIIVSDTYNNTLHILNNCGQFIFDLHLTNKGIKLSYSLALSSSRHLYIGCTCEKGSPETYKAELYELEYEEI